MSRRPLLLALVAATAVSLVAAWRELACSSCSGGLPLGILGTAFHACAAIAVGCFGLRRPFALAVFAATGFHLGLALLMLLRGPFCATCLAAAACATLASAVILYSRRELADLAGAVAPWTAALAFVLPLNPAVRDIDLPATPGSPLQITVYSREGCQYCTRLRDDVLPAALAGLEGQVGVRWVDAPAPTRVPSLVISRADRGGGRFIEGLPPADFLRAEIDRALGRTP